MLWRKVTEWMVAQFVANRFFLCSRERHGNMERGKEEFEREIRIAGLCKGEKNEQWWVFYGWEIVELIEF